MRRSTGGPKTKSSSTLSARCGSPPWTPGEMEEVEEEKVSAPHAPLDRRTEDEEQQHVEREVREPAVDELIGQERPGAGRGLAGRELQQVHERRRGETRVD